MMTKISPRWTLKLTSRTAAISSWRASVSSLTDAPCSAMTRSAPAPKTFQTFSQWTMTSSSRP